MHIWVKRQHTIKPIYKGPVYSGHPVYYGQLAISQGWPLYTGLSVVLSTEPGFPLGMQNDTDLFGTRLCDKVKF